MHKEYQRRLVNITMEWHENIKLQSVIKDYANRELLMLNLRAMKILYVTSNCFGA